LQPSNSNNSKSILKDIISNNQVTAYHQPKINGGVSDRHHDVMWQLNKINKKASMGGGMGRKNSQKLVLDHMPSQELIGSYKGHIAEEKDDRIVDRELGN
jgi:hypothetical protein